MDLSRGQEWVRQYGWWGELRQQAGGHRHALLNSNFFLQLDLNNRRIHIKIQTCNSLVNLKESHLISTEAEKPRPSPLLTVYALGLLQTHLVSIPCPTWLPSSLGTLMQRVKPKT